MLLQIRDYIARKGVVSTQQLTREFHLEQQALLPMLAIWVAKGVIQQCEDKKACRSSCFRCKTQTTPIFYQFITK